MAPSDIGMGLFATRDFQAGEFLFRFFGPLIGAAEVIAKGDAEGNPLQIGPHAYVDVQPPGVFINHSCDPNAGIRNSVDAYALREIRSGEEIRFDYSTTMSERRWTMTCRCGAQACRGVVGDFHELPEPLQHKYLRLKVVQPFIVEEVAARSVSEFANYWDVPRA